MAFQLAYFGQLSTGQSTSFTINYTTQQATAQGTCNSFAYNGLAAGENQATLMAVDYFLPVTDQLKLGDYILCSATDGNILLYVSSITYTNSAGAGATVDTTSVIPVAGVVQSVSGTANRITSTGGVNPVIDISAAYVGQGSITTVGTIAAGTWNGTVVASTYGGTGVNNGSSTITIGGNVTFSGAHAFTGTLTGATSVTFPTSGTLATTADLPTLPLSPANGGTGVNNGSNTLTIGANSSIDQDVRTTAVPVFNNVNTKATVITSAAGVTSLTNTSNYYQVVTGTNTQTIKLPDTSTLTLGWSCVITNQSTLPVFVTSFASNGIVSLMSGASYVFFCVSVGGNTAAAWAAVAFGNDPINMTNNVQTSTVVFTESELNGAYATPILILQNNDIGATIFLEKCILQLTYTSGSITGGGNLRLQYGNTAAAAGQPASLSVSAAQMATVNADCTIRFDGYQANPLPNTVKGTSLYLTNETAAFSGTFVGFMTAVCWYSTYQN